MTTINNRDADPDKIDFAPPPQFSGSDVASSSGLSARPPPFSSLYFPYAAELDRLRATVAETACDNPLVSAPAPSFEEALAEDEAESKAPADSKAALPQDSKAQSSKAALDEGEPPPPYTEGSSPLDSFSYVMATAGGPASIITQVQQSAGPPINTLGGGFDCPLRSKGSRKTNAVQQLERQRMSTSHWI